MKKLLLLCFLPLLFTSCNNQSGNSSAENEDLAVTEKIARAHGFENFDEVETLKYTFNVSVNDSLRSRRSWEWNPQTNEVSLSAGDSTVTYNQKSEAEEFRTTDERFINDKYWFLYPFHLVWDDMEYEHEEEATAPISGESLQKVRVIYPEGAGYTPGDVYEVYFGDDYIMREWVYQPGGDAERSFATTWEDYQNFNGLQIATMHRSEDGSFELFFTGIEVTME